MLSPPRCQGMSFTQKTSLLPVDFPGLSLRHTTTAALNTEPAARELDFTGRDKSKPCLAPCIMGG